MADWQVPLPPPAERSRAEEETQDWNRDPYLLGVASASLDLAMQSEDWPMLLGYVRELERRGADVGRLYAQSRARHPNAPSLAELPRCSQLVGP